MQKFLFSVLCVGILAGCEKTEQSDFAAPVEQELENATIFPDGVPVRLSYAEAVGVAEQGIRMLEDGVSTRATGRTIDDSQVKAFVPVVTRSGEADTLMYVFNFADSAGFAIVSSFRETEQLLAVTESGSYTPGEPTGNPALDWYLSSLEEEISAYAARGGNGTNGMTLPEPPGPPGTYPTKIERAEYTSTTGPLVPVAWGQDCSPYNSELLINKNLPIGEKYPAGCVATAIAQIMSVYAYPTSIVLTYDGTNKNKTLDWANMLCFYNNNRHTGVIQIETTDNIGFLMAEIGKRVNMSYEKNNKNKKVAKASNNNVPTGFTSFGYHISALKSYSSSSVRSEVAQGRPVYMSGTDTSHTLDDDDVGHAWVIDGYKTVTRVTTTYWAETSDGPWFPESRETQTFYYNHCNWGWEEAGNGYFSENQFSVGDKYEYDNPSEPGTPYRFSSDLKMFTDIYPGY